MENQEQMKEQEESIKGFYTRDICAYCNVKWFENILIKSYRLEMIKELYLWAEKKQKGWYYPAGILQALWFAYHNMIGTACLSMAMNMTFYALFQVIVYRIFYDYFVWVGIVLAWILGGIVVGNIAIPLYGKKIFRYLDGCGLRNRTHEPNEELEKMLQKRGRKSILSVIFFIALQFLIFACVEGLFIMFKYR